MRTRALHKDFGVEVLDVDLRQVTRQSGLAEIRQAFETHSLLLFRGQELDEATHRRLTTLFGPIEDRSRGANGPTPKEALVSNKRDDGGVAPEDDHQLLQLVANQLWHTDSTFIPEPALVNVLLARVLPSGGGETDFVSTRAGWSRLPEELKARLRGTVFHHRYAHSRQKISEALARDALFTMWEDQAWRAVWPNPANGEEALYIASHVFAVEGLGEAEGQALVNDLIARMTEPGSVYSHEWQLGDVLIWDERATLHRGRPWPYGEERTLSSFVASATAADGLDRVRPQG